MDALFSNLPLRIVKEFVDSSLPSCEEYGLFQLGWKAYLVCWGIW